MKLHLIIVVFFLSYVFACQRKIDDPIVSFGPSAKVDIVYYFKTGTTNNEINYFQDNVVSNPSSNGKGNSLMQGIRGTFLVRTQNYEGYAIELRKVTEAERENILKTIKGSPLIYKVFENVVPNEIILDPVKAEQEKKELEKAKKDNRPTKTIVITNSSETK